MPILFDPVLNRRRHRRVDRNLRGLKPPVYCHHCSRKIHGWVNWVGKEPYCSYCYGFRAVLIERKKQEKMDPLTKEELKKRLLQEGIEE